MTSAEDGVGENAARPANPEHPPGAGRGGIVPPVEHRFKPGNRANPGGMPKKRPISRPLARYLRMPLETALRIVDDPKAPAAKAIAARMVILCHQGDAKILAQTLERMEGKVPQAIQHDTPPGGLRVVIEADEPGED